MTIGSNLSLRLAAILLVGFILLQLLIAAVAIWLKQLSLAMVVLPVYFVLLGLFSLGLAWIAAGLHVYLRDTAQVLAVALTAWFWLTPVFLFEGQFKAPIDRALPFNPLVYVVRGYRDSILGNRLPALADVAVLCAFAVASFVAGGLFFRHTKRGFADVL